MTTLMGLKTAMVISIHRKDNSYSFSNTHP